MSFGFPRFEREKVALPFGGGLLIPVSMNEVVHVTSADLHNGTSHAGPIWTKNGSVPTVAATGSNPKRAAVGPFSSGNFFSRPSPSPIDFTGAGPMTCTMVLANNVVGDDTDPVSAGDVAGSGGWGLQNWSSSGGAALFGIFPFTSLVFRFPWNTTGLQVLTWGIDGSGNAICGLNGAAGTPVAATILPPNGIGAFIGIGSGGIVNPFNGLIYEFAASTDPCDSTAISTINAAVIANY